MSRFRREARILASLDHPHVVRVFDYRESEEQRLLVMELLTGGTLADRRAAGLSLETAVATVMAAACGLHHVHEQGILHRDVKPENRYCWVDADRVARDRVFVPHRVQIVRASSVNAVSIFRCWRASRLSS